jgi:energy-coupling factor transporter ATP-binding protein EcfA2
MHLKTFESNMEKQSNSRFQFQLDEFYLDLQKDGQDIVYINQRNISEDPFPGLRPFKTSEVPIFKGRDNQVGELLKRLDSKNFLAVIGSSGTGKSSLIRAGLIPQLSGGYLYKAGSKWNVAICRPGENPIQNLAIALASLKCGSKSKEDISAEYAGIEDLLLSSTFGILDFNASVNIESNAGNLLIIIDQFEEIFRFKEKAITTELESHFINLLLDATANDEKKIYVIITMRSEFLGDCVKFRRLPEAINAGQYLVPQLAGLELRKAIIDPIERAGHAIDASLVEILINELEQNEINIENLDYLPILQHALMRTYKYALQKAKPNEKFVVTVSDYEAIGGMKKALDIHAEAAFAQLSGNGDTEYSNKQIIAKIVFQLLTDSSTELKGGRRPVEVSEVYKVVSAINVDKYEVDEVIDHFRSDINSFIMPNLSTKLYEELKIDISHESLMRNWGRLRIWMEEEVQHAMLYKTLNDRRSLHKKVGLKDQWITGGLLDELLKWRKDFSQNKHWAKRYNISEKKIHIDKDDNDDIFEANISFLSESEKTEYNRIASENKARASKLKLRYFAISGFIILMAIALMYMRVSNISNAGFSMAALNNLDSIEGNKIVPLKIAIKAYNNFQLLGIPKKIREDGINGSRKKIIDLYNLNNLGAKVITVENTKSNQNLYLQSYSPIKNDSLIVVNYAKFNMSSAPREQSASNFAIYESPNNQMADTSIIYNTISGNVTNSWSGQAFWLKNQDWIAVLNKFQITGYRAGDNKPLKKWTVNYNNNQNGQIKVIKYFKTSNDGFLIIINEAGEEWVFDTSVKEYLKAFRREQVKKGPIKEITGSYFLSNGNILILSKVYENTFPILRSRTNLRSSKNTAEIWRFDKYKGLMNTQQANYDNYYISNDRTKLLLQLGKVWTYFDQGTIEKLEFSKQLGDFGLAKFDLRNNICFLNDDNCWIYNNCGIRTAQIQLNPGKKSLLDFQNGVVAIKVHNPDSLRRGYFDVQPTKIIFIEKKRGRSVWIKNLTVKESYGNQWILSNDADSIIFVRNEIDSAFESKTIYEVSDRKTSKLLRAFKIYSNDKSSYFSILNRTIEQNDREQTPIISSSFVFSNYVSGDFNKRQIKYFDVNRMAVTSPDNLKQIIAWADTVRTSKAETNVVNNFIHYTNPWTTATN